VQWGQKIKVEIVPIPLPMKDQKVLFVKGIDIEKSDKEVAEFINNTFTQERLGSKFIKMDIINKHNIPKAVLYFDQAADINAIIEKTNEMEFSGNSQKLKVQKYQSKQERVREQTEKEKNKPLNLLYLQGLRQEIT
jgi:gamma-glutamyl-gamma-aminobutyrate hydrolase PuuD